MTGDTKDPFYASFYPQTWGEATHIGERLSNRCIFRGHADSDWDLSTPIERAAIRGGLPLELLPDQERWILHEFGRRIHHYLEEPQSGWTDLDLLAFLQHHGGPTRLLDFTHSFFVAAFFAAEHCDEEAAVCRRSWEARKESRWHHTGP